MSSIGDYGYISDLKRSNASAFGTYSNGPYIGEVVDHLDDGKNGVLRVVLLRGSSSNSEQSDKVAIPVSYAPMFFGNTPYIAMDPNNRQSNSTQTSYGMWFIPPDVGTRVLVHFIEGDVNRGYWTNCIPEPGVNHMVPGIASSTNVELTPQEKTKLGTDDVPVSETNRRLKGQRKDDIDKIKRPMHPFALRLATQGLLKDPIRGISTSSARRSVPSSVFGISTPGPPVVGGKKYKVGPKDNQFDVYAEREGGTQFVMDDGVVGKDERTGALGVKDELVRIRTRTGHQILLHNSSDLIYICNSKGTAWLEFTSNGKIDIFAADSVSIHSEVDFNFRADRSINLEAGANINIVANRGSIHLEAGGILEGFAGKDVNFTATDALGLTATGKIALTSRENLTNPLSSGIDLYSTSGIINAYASRGVKIKSLLDTTVYAGMGMNIISGVTGTVIKSGGPTDITSATGNFITALGGANVFKATAGHIERATLIDMNGPTPAPVNTTYASTLKTALDALEALPVTASVVAVMDTYVLPYREADKNATKEQQKGWENNNYYRQPDIRSIMKRVPSHEPWDHHENISPEEFTPAKTDRDGTNIN